MGGVEEEEQRRERSEDEDEGVEEGKVKMRMRRSPKEPTRAEVEAHRLTHLPYRSWCRHCVRGRGITEACRKEDYEEDEHAVPEIHMDYCFPRHEDAEVGLTVLVGREKGTRMTMGTVVPMKGGREVCSEEDGGVDEGDRMR